MKTRLSLSTALFVATATLAVALAAAAFAAGATGQGTAFAATGGAAVGLLLPVIAGLVSRLRQALREEQEL